MTNSQGGGTNEVSAAAIIKNEVYLEDEINLINYFRVLWKRKWFIFLASVLPALVVGLAIFLWPRDYKVTYVYDVRENVRDGMIENVRDGMIEDARDGMREDAGSWNLNKKNYDVMLSRFYSEENLSKLIDKLQKNKLAKYAEQLNKGSDQSENIVKFEAIPPFLNLSKLNVTDPGQLDKIRDMKALLLNVTITGRPAEDIYKASSVIRDNIENVMPLYMVQEQLATLIREYNNNLADIERDKFSLEMVLKNNNGILAGLKNVNIGAADSNRTNVTLQFDIGSQTEYLPLNYQIQAAETKRVKLEESIKANEEKYKYYKDLLDLNNRIATELSSKLSSDYSVKQFKLFLADLVAGYEKPQLKDYLSSYIKKIENRVSAGKPITENPRVYPIAKGTVKKSGIVFAVSLMTAVFAAFLLEGLRQNKVRNEK
jgi:hypothetical protein